MPLYNVIRGVAATADVEFRDTNGAPVVPVGPVQWRVLDTSGNLVVSGTATQDPGNTARWLATITIPTNAPVPTDGKKYRLSWLITNATTSQTASEYFTLLAEGEMAPLDEEVLLYAGQPFRDTLITDEAITSADVTVMNELSTSLYTGALSTTPNRIINGIYHYDHTSGSAVAGMGDLYTGVIAFLANYNYATASKPFNTKIHAVIVMGPKMAMLIHDLRRYLDKARNFDMNPALRFTDVELSHFTLMGLQRFNVQHPVSSYDFSNFPSNLYMALQKCAAVEALNAWYLAEGVSAFDFQGQATQLNVDRTQYIQYKIDELNNWIDQNLSKIKTDVKRQLTGMGHLNMTITPATNWINRTPVGLGMLWRLNRFSGNLGQSF